MSDSRLKIAYITAGAAGMYCGSCLHDNTLAAALGRIGADVQLIPTYTPIRTDEQDVSIDRVFLGGINVVLQQKIPLFRYVPQFLDRFFDQPWLIRWASSHGVKTSPKELGALTVSMLRGLSGFQRKEVRKLCEYLGGEVRPDVIILSNVLIAGCLPTLKKSLQVPVLVTLQGDDIFLDGLPEPYKSQSLAEIRKLASHVDGFLTHSQFYAQHMSGYLGIGQDAFHQVPLGIDTRDFREFLVGAESGDGAAAASRGTRGPVQDRPPTIGYLARLAPEKGLHVLVDAFVRLRRRPGLEQARLRIAGWLGDGHRVYAEGEFARLKAAGLADSVQFDGTVDRHGKIEFLKRIDVLSVPTVYREPKGIYVLEALAAGVPVVQPEHGAFPELLATTGGGLMVRPNDPQHLADTLARLLVDHEARLRLGRAGCQVVHERLHADAMAQGTLDVVRRFLRKNVPAEP